MNKYDKKMHELGGRFFGAPRGEPAIALSEDDLLKVESKLGYALPADYREFLRDYGGYDVLPHFVFPLKNATDGETEGVASFFMAVLPKPPYGIFHGVDLLLEYKECCHSEWELNAFPGFTALRPVSDKSRFIERAMNFSGTEVIRLVDPDNGWFGDDEQLYLPWPQELLPIASQPGHNLVALSLKGEYVGAIFYLQTIPNSIQNFYLVADSFDDFMQSAKLDDKTW